MKNDENLSYENIDFTSDIIKKIRKLLGSATRDLSQSDLAELLGVAWQTVNRWERTNVRPSLMARGGIISILKQYKITADQLIEKKENDENP